MLRAIAAAGCDAEHELDWGGLVKRRTAQQARRRWRLMLKCVPDRYERSFAEVVEYLVDTYVPELRRLLTAPAE